VRQRFCTVPDSAQAISASWREVLLLLALAATTLPLPAGWRRKGTMPDLRKGYWVALLPCERTTGALAIALVARRTYSIPIDNPTAQPLPDDEQPPFLVKDRCDEGDVMVAAPTLEGELVPEKAHADVIVVGKAYAPGGKALPEFECGIRVGSRQQRLRIVGPRKCLYTQPRKQDGKLVPQPPRFSEPEPVKDVVLSFSNAYGGKTRVIPDDATLRIQRQVQAVMAAEKAEADKQQEAAQAGAKAAADKKAKEDKEKALFDSLGPAAEEDVARSDGKEGYDWEGVRMAGRAASKSGVAILRDGDLDKQRAQAAQLAQTPAPKAPERRRTAEGDVLEVDEGVEILTDDLLAAELAKSKAEQHDAAQALAAASAARSGEKVESFDGALVLDGASPQIQDEWERTLRAGFLATDDAEQKARMARIAERKKLEDEKLAEFPELPCPTNPYGKGFCVSPHEAILSRLELPLIEDPQAPLTPRDLLQDWLALDKVPLPVGFSTYPRQARPRIELAGPYPSDLKGWDKKLEEQKRALDLKKQEDVAVLRELDRRQEPEAMKPGYWNAAAPTMQWGALTGDEEVTLTHLTKDGTLHFRLPGKVLEAELDRGRGIERTDLKLDTLIIEPDLRQVTLLWRAHFSLQNLGEIEDYPHLLGWVLDLDVGERKERDWAAAARRARGDGTQVLDLSQMPIAQEVYLEAKTPAAMAADQQALELEKMGTYRQVEDDGWVGKASDGTVDEAAEAKRKKEEEAYVKEKAQALKALEEKEKKDAERRAEIAKAAQEGKPVPPPGSKKPKK